MSYLLLEILAGVSVLAVFSLLAFGLAAAVVVSQELPTRGRPAVHRAATHWPHGIAANSPSLRIADDR
jgi:hypothetical protein